MTAEHPWARLDPKGAAFLKAHGIDVQPQDIPGLYRINGGPELTHGQMLQEVGRMVSALPEPQMTGVIDDR